MSRQRKPLVLGNWKMNGCLTDNEKIITTFLTAYQNLPFADNLDCGICPPTLYLSQIISLLKGSTVVGGAQDVSAQLKGAYTGEVAASMLADIGCRYVIIGHSERRQYHHETDKLIVAKAEQVAALGMIPVYCVGENLEDRANGQQDKVVGTQVESICGATPETLDALVIAYEPVWAIGTGKTATTEQAQTMHELIRETVKSKHTLLSKQIKVLYGGSVNEKNASDLSGAKDVDGFLIGGASLQPQSFIKICEVFL